MSHNSGQVINADLVVLGGGPAGLAAAVAASQLGTDCLLIERSDELGGQIVGVSPDSARHRTLEPEVVETKRLVAHLSAKTRVLTGATVWRADTYRHLHIVQGDTTKRVDCQALVIATGAYERPLLFDGWSLPGVVTAGAAQRMATRSLLAIGNRVLMAGRGPLLLQSAAQLVACGVKVVGVIEATPLKQMLKAWRLALLDPHRLKQAIRYWSILRGAGVPLRYGEMILEASGQSQVERATTVRINSDGKNGEGGQQTWEVDAIGISNGLVPDLRLCRSLGCELDYDPRTEAFFARHDLAMRTNLPGVYVAGEVAGIGGANTAILEGELAGVQAAVELKIADEKSLAPRLESLRQQSARARQRMKAADAAFVLPSTMLATARPETLVCRCEEVSLGALRSAIEAGDGSALAVKLRTRISMGMCQGRLCEVTLYQLLAASAGGPPTPAELLSERPPFEPVTVGQIAALEL